MDLYQNLLGVDPGNGDVLHYQFIRFSLFLQLILPEGFRVSRRAEARQHRNDQQGRNAHESLLVKKHRYISLSNAS